MCQVLTVDQTTDTGRKTVPAAVIATLLKLTDGKIAAAYEEAAFVGVSDACKLNPATSPPV